MRASMLTLLGILTAMSGCDRVCPLGSCQDNLLLTVTLSEEPGTYTFTFVTKAGTGSCILAVPLAFGSSDCDESDVVRWAPKDETTDTVAEFSLLNVTAAEVTVRVADELVYSGALEADPGSGFEQEGSDIYCDGPCETTTTSLDLTGIPM